MAHLIITYVSTTRWPSYILVTRWPSNCQFIRLSSKKGHLIAEMLDIYLFTANIAMTR